MGKLTVSKIAYGVSKIPTIQLDYNEGGVVPTYETYTGKVDVSILDAIARASLHGYEVTFEGFDTDVLKSILKTCPRCGEAKMHEVEARNALSRFREGVFICGGELGCDTDEAMQDFSGEPDGVWWVDRVTASTDLSVYHSALYEYDTLSNCSDDKVRIEKSKQKLNKLELNRVPKYVVEIDSEDGSSAVAEFDNRNLALARVFGWLGKNYNVNGKDSWVGAYGSVISIENY